MNEPITLDTLLERGQHLIAIDSFEEARVIEQARELASRRGLPLYRWSITGGLREIPANATFAAAATGDPWSDTLVGQAIFPDAPAGDSRFAGGPTGPSALAGRPAGPSSLAGARDATAAPGEALRRIAALPSGLFLLFDLHRHLADALLSRQLRELAALPGSRFCVLVGHAPELPGEFEKIAARLTLPAPTRDELLAILREEAIALRRERPEAAMTGDAGALPRLLDHLAGLTASDARLIARDILRDDGRLTVDDLTRVFRAKKALLGERGVLSMETAAGSLDDIAGMARLKSWLKTREPAFSGAAEGLDPPKGILLLGVQGCGKSMAAKAVAAAWHVPLLRIDFGALYNKFLGETERNLRDSLAQADAMAPCALWLDEIEKGLATGSSDGGESRRLLGTLLTWMAERRSRVFMIATSNDIEQLPPELIRKGRFDEIFFVDLPSAENRAAILGLHLTRRQQNAADFDLAELARQAEGFSGAELEQAVVGALYAVRAENRALDAAAITAEITRTKPLSVVMAEKIAWLRLWASERTVPAD